MERKIGEIFEHNGEWYQCVKSPDGSCKHCDMNFDGKCPIPIKECTESGRNDKSYVVFKKLEKVGEPFTIVGKLYQHYKAFDINNVCGDSFWCVNNYNEKILTIEIKQNKEYMEESVEEKLFCDKVAKANAEYMKVKLNSSLKPFDIEAAKSGKPVCTSDGRKARIICFDRKDVRPLIALIQSDNGGEGVYYYYANGLNLDNYPSAFDLMMLPEKKEGWVNVYKFATVYVVGTLFDNEEDARKDRLNPDYIATIKIEWEE